MAPAKKQFATMDEYINSFPKDVQSILEKVRQTIRKAAPEAEETISYQIPTFKLNGRYLVYFAGWKSHISLYPIPAGAKSFEKEIAPYKKGKGTVQFALDKPVPYGLITKIVKLHMKENAAKKK